MAGPASSGDIPPRRLIMPRGRADRRGRGRVWLGSEGALCQKVLDDVQGMLGRELEIRTALDDLRYRVFIVGKGRNHCNGGPALGKARLHQYAMGGRAGGRGLQLMEEILVCGVGLFCRGILFNVAEMFFFISMVATSLNKRVRRGLLAVNTGILAKRPSFRQNMYKQRKNKPCPGYKPACFFSIKLYFVVLLVYPTIGRGVYRSRQDLFQPAGTLLPRVAPFTPGIRLRPIASCLLSAAALKIIRSGASALHTSHGKSWPSVWRLSRVPGCFCVLIIPHGGGKNRCLQNPFYFSTEIPGSEGNASGKDFQRPQYERLRGCCES